MKNRLCSFILLVCCCATLLSARGPCCESENNVRSGVLDALHPLIDQNTHFWLRADVLYLFPQTKSIVLTNKETDLFTTADVTLEPTIKPDFKGNVGFRMNFGYIFQNTLWDMAITWTHFNTDVQQRRCTHGDIGVGMFPIWSLADDIIAFDWVAKAKMHWKPNLNLFDLDFGRAFSLKDQFFLRLIIGLRATWMYQHLNASYGGGIFANGLNLPEIDSTFGYDCMRMKNNFWAIGPRLGIEPQLNLGCGWRLYSHVVGTISYACFNIHQKETYLKTVRYEGNRSPHGFRGMLDAAAGISWKTFCGRNRYALTCALGWEYHLFLKVLELKGDAFDLVSDDRNLSLNGLAFSACLDF